MESVITPRVSNSGENLSFISYELINSSQTLLLEDGDGDDESYIEIALEPTRSRRLGCGGDEGEKELHVSFSSVCSLDANIKATTMTERMSRGIMAKLLIKFGSANILRTALAAFTRPQRRLQGQFNYGSEKQKRSEGSLCSYAENLMKLFEGSCLDQSGINYGSGKDTRGIKSLRSNGKRFARVVEVYVEGIRGALQSISTRIDRKDKLTIGCTTSAEHSPVHNGYLANQSEMYSIDSSIKAAIAHCKSSLGRP